MPIGQVEGRILAFPFWDFELIPNLFHLQFGIMTQNLDCACIIIAPLNRHYVFVITL